MDQVFPQKAVFVGPDDKPYFTEELRQLKRQRQRAYRLHGRRSNTYLRLEKRFGEKLKSEAMKYKNKIEREVLEGKRNSAYNAIRKLGNRPGEAWNKAVINLPAYKEQDLTPLQAADKLAIYFSSISQTVEPLDESKFLQHLS